jgi:hypothetical protein
MRVAGSGHLRSTGQELESVQGRGQGRPPKVHMGELGTACRGRDPKAGESAHAEC